MMTKTMLNQEWDMGIEAAIEAEAQAQAICMQTEDFRRAYRAFVAKRHAGVRGQLSAMPDRSFLAWPFFEARHRALAAEVERLAADARPIWTSDADVDATCRMLVGALAEAGLLRHAVPAAYGGSERAASTCARSASCARRSPASPALADFAFAMQGLGIGAITPVRQRGAAPHLPARGRRKAARSRRSRCRSRRPAPTSRRSPRPPSADGDGFVLNGAKTWISNGGIADFYVVFARTGEAPGAKGLSAFIVDADTPGLEIAERIELIAPHPLATLRFEDCRVPRDRLLGEPGQGFKIAMATLDVFRPTVGAAALGFARRALDEALARASSRQLFGGPLAELQMIQAKLADMALSGRCRGAAGLSRRLGQGCRRRAHHPRGRDGQAVRDRGGAAR